MFAPLLAVALLAPLAPPRLTQKEAEARFFRAWVEIKRVDNGWVYLNRHDLLGEDFAPDGTVCWNRTGELDEDRRGTIRIDAAARPMRVDFVHDERDHQPGRPQTVVTGIFMFVGGQLVVATGEGAANVRKLKPGQDYAGRPKDFTSTKQNRQRVSTYRAGYYLEQD